MGKHQKAEKREVGKTGSPPSGTKNEKAHDKKRERASLPRVRKVDVGTGRKGGGLH